MIHLQQHYIAQYHINFSSREKDMLSNKEITLLHKKDIAIDFAKVNRFKGKAVAMGKIGQKKVYSKIITRLDQKKRQHGSSCVIQQ